MEKNKRIIFNLPAEATTAEIIKMILGNNGLKEGTKEYLEKLKKGEETSHSIMRDATFVLVQKKIPENNLVELLVKHLKVSNETATKIISDIKKELIPYAEIISIPTDDNKEEKENFQEKLLDKIKNNAPQQKPETESEILMSYDKKPAIMSVEKNAENMNKEGQNMTTKEKDKLPQENKTPPAQNSKSDTYREPIE